MTNAELQKIVIFKNVIAGFDSQKHISKLKRKLSNNEGFAQTSDKIVRLKMLALDEKIENNVIYQRGVQFVPPLGNLD